MRILQGFSGGEEGITANRGAGPHLFGLTLGPQLQVYYVIAFWAFVAAVLMSAFASSCSALPPCSPALRADCTRSTTRSSQQKRWAPVARAQSCSWHTSA